MRVLFKKTVKISLLLLSVVMITLRSETTTASSTQQNQVWATIAATGDFNKINPLFARLTYLLEAQQRLIDKASQTLLRPGIGYNLTPTTSIWMGYAYIYTEPPSPEPSFVENRIWQQLLWSRDYSHWTLTSRSRLEERFIQPVASTLFRFRELIKIVIPATTDSNFSFVASDEIFWHINDFDSWQKQGLDQNRFFIGFRNQITKTLHTEVGYMNQFINVLNRENLTRHTLSINFFFNY